MSTIEEAREQAREALPGALARLVENRLGKSLAREADKDMIALRAAANAIVALLDATEPPAQAEPAEDEREVLLIEIQRVQRAAWAEIHRQDARRKYSVAEVKQIVYSFDNVLSLVLRGPRPITDEMVEDALDTWFDQADSGAYSVEAMRAALEAAEEARR